MCLAFPGHDLRTGRISHRNCLAITSDASPAEWLMLGAHHSAHALQRYRGGKSACVSGDYGPRMFPHPRRVGTDARLWRFDTILAGHSLL